MNWFAVEEDQDESEKHGRQEVILMKGVAATLDILVVFLVSNGERMLSRTSVN